MGGGGASSPGAGGVLLAEAAGSPVWRTPGPGWPEGLPSPAGSPLFAVGGRSGSGGGAGGGSGDGWVPGGLPLAPRSVPGASRRYVNDVWYSDKDKKFGLDKRFDVERMNAVAQQLQSNSEAVDEVMNGLQVAQGDLSAMGTWPGVPEAVRSRAVECRQALRGYGSLLDGLHANTGDLAAAWVAMEAEVTRLLRGISKASEPMVAQLHETSAKLDRADASMKALVQQVAQAREAETHSLQLADKLEAELQELRAAVGESVRTQAAGALLKAFQMWRSDAREAASKRRKLAKFLRNWKYKETRAALLAWHSNVAEWKAQRQRAYRAIKRMGAPYMALGFYTWRDGVRERKAALARARRVLKRMLHLRASAAFGQWCHATALQRDEREGRGRAEKEELRRQEVARRLLHRLMNAGLSKTFNQWAAWAAECHRQKVVVQRCVQKMLQRELAAGFWEWHEMVGELKRQRAVVSRALMRIKQRAVLECWDGWCEAVANAFELRQAEEAERREEERRERVVQKVLQRMRQAGLAAAWAAWHDFYATLKHQRLVVQKCLGRITNRALAQAFEQWLETAAEQRAEEAEGQRREQVGLQLLKRLMNAGLSKTFNQWAAWAAECHRQKVVVQRCVQKMLQRELAAGFWEWHEAVDDLKRQRLLVARVVAKIGRRSLILCWDSWLQVTFDSVQESELEKMRAQEALRQEQLMAKVLKRAQKSKLFQAWGRWLENVLAVRHERELLQRVLVRMANRCLSASFAAWADAWQDLKVQRHRLDVCVRRMRQRELFGALHQWRESVEEIKAEAVTQERHELVVARVLKRMLNAALAQAFACWQTSAEEAKTHRCILQRSVARMRNREMTGAFERWRECVQTLKQHRVVLQRALARMRQKVVVQCWDTWAWSVSQLKRAKMVAEALLLKKRLETSADCVGAAWSAWKEMRHKHKRARLAAWIQRIRSRGYLAAAFYRWAAWTISNIHKTSYNTLGESFASLDLGSLTLSLPDNPGEVSRDSLHKVVANISTALEDVREILGHGQTLVAHVRRARAMVNGGAEAAPAVPGLGAIEKRLGGLTSEDLGLSPGAQHLLLIRKAHTAEVQRDRYMTEFLDSQAKNITSSSRLASVETELELTRRQNVALEDAVATSSSALKDESAAKMVWTGVVRPTPRFHANSQEKRKQLEHDFDALMSARRDLDSDLKRATSAASRPPTSAMKRAPEPGRLAGGGTARLSLAERSASKGSPATPAERFRSQYRKQKLALAGASSQASQTSKQGV